MILVDSSVWIDLYRGRTSAVVDRLQDILPQQRALVGDLILAEVLQGFGDDLAFEKARRRFEAFPIVRIADGALAVQAARNYRTLRTLGITPRKTIDTLIATRCIADGIDLLYSDRDFDPFVEHLGLRSAL